MSEETTVYANFLKENSSIFDHGKGLLSDFKPPGSKKRFDYVLLPNGKLNRYTHNSGFSEVPEEMILDKFVKEVGSKGLEKAVETVRDALDKGEICNRW